MNFTTVLAYLEQDSTKAFFRTSWSGGKYIILMGERCIEECFITPHTSKVLGVPPTRGYRIRPFLLIKTKYDYEFTVYHASFEDLTAVDWEEKIKE